MSDSDATRSPESVETLPPDSPVNTRGCQSPDLFEDSSSNEPLATMANIPKVSHGVKKRRSEVHEMSDSDTDDSNVGHQNRPETNIKRVPDRKQFINDFLNMSSSDSDDDQSMLSPKKKTGCSPAKHNKSNSNVSVEGRYKGDSTNKPHKQNYSRPFLSDVSESKPKHASSTQQSDKSHGVAKTTPSKSSPNLSAKGSSDRKLSSVSKSLNPSPHKVKDSEKQRDGKNIHITKTAANGDKEGTSHKQTNESSKLHRTKVPNELRKAVTEILNENNSAKRKKKTPCQYGAKCYRRNPSHFEEFSHNSDSEEDETQGSKIPQKKAKISSSPQPSTSKPMTPKKSSSQAGSKSLQGSRSPLKMPRTIQEKLAQAEPYNFFLTHVVGIKEQFNSSYVLDIKEILSADMGNLVASCQFNFMFDIGWLIRQYPSQFRSKPMLIVHGEKGPSMTNLQAQAMSHSNIRFCQAKLDMPYGTHHTKMMLLLYDNGMRVVIHTSNLIENDWHQKTQGIWVSPLFPRLQTAGAENGDSPTHFKQDLIQYISAYRAYQLKEWIEHISKHDMSAAKVVIVGSVPGRHLGQKAMSTWGHGKLKSALHKHGPSPSLVKTWPVIGQFSSIGSMGPSKDNWLCSEWLNSLSTTKAGAGPQTNARLQLIFPSKDNVRLSLEGFPAGGSIPYSHNTAKKQTYLHDFFHVWRSEGRGRSRAMPHIKTYMRPVQDGSRAAWFCCTSANLSKAAWGALEKKGTQLMIRSYEIGVLFLPTFYQSGEETFPVSSDPSKAWSNNALPIPYDLPPRIYEKKDRPWMWDIPYMDLPDTNGNVWCPFSK